MDIAVTDTVIRRAGVLSTMVDGCVVLLDSDRQVFVGFDDAEPISGKRSKNPLRLPTCARHCRRATPRSVPSLKVMSSNSSISWCSRSLSRSPPDTIVRGVPLR
jgi:hypothetical protein